MWGYAAGDAWRSARKVLESVSATKNTHPRPKCQSKVRSKNLGLCSPENFGDFFSPKLRPNRIPREVSAIFIKCNVRKCANIWGSGSMTAPVPKKMPNFLSHRPAPAIPAPGMQNIAEVYGRRVSRRAVKRGPKISANFLAPVGGGRLCNETDRLIQQFYGTATISKHNISYAK